MEFNPFWIFGVAALGFVWVVVHQQRKAKQRQEALQALAERLLLQFYAQDETERMAKTLRKFQLFRKGTSYRAANILIGQQKDYQQLMFDLSYTTGSGRNRRTVRQTVMVLERPQARLSAFMMEPESGILHKISNFFGIDDIDFDSHPEFSNQYLLKGEDENAIRACFSSRVLDYFTNQPGLTVAGNDRYLIVYRSHKLLPPEEKAYRELIRLGDDLVGLLLKI